MSIWNKLYDAYKNKDCKQFQEYWKWLSKKEKESQYFWYYSKLKNEICPQQEEKQQKILLKWKTIKCTHCGSPLTLSEYNKEQIKKLKNGAWQVEFMCSSCWVKFVYTKRLFKTIFTKYKVWQEIEIDWKKYKLAWAVKYKWNYKEWSEWWSLEYIEWLAYDKKWELFYISESRAKDGYWTYDELEISQKINFPFAITNITWTTVYTDQWDYDIGEIDEVKVVSVIWDLNKTYKIWEKIKIYSFEKYSLEEERWTNSIERNLYKTISTNSVNNVWVIQDSSNYRITDNDRLPIVFWWLIYLWPLLAFLFIEYVIYIIVLSLFLFVLYKFSKSKLWKKYNLGNVYIYLWILVFFLIWWYYSLRYAPVEKTKAIAYKNWKEIDNWNYSWDFANKYIYSQYLRTYDYGWRKYKKYDLKWFYFSINDDKDKQAFSYFIEHWNEIINNYYKNYDVRKALNNKKIQLSDNDLIIKYKRWYEK